MLFVNGQEINYDILVEQHLEKRNKIKSHNLKALSVISHKNGNLNKTKLILEETYDRNGNISKCVKRNFKKQKVKKEFYYEYDSLKRIKKIVSKNSYSKTNKETIELTYENQKSQLKFIVKYYGDLIELSRDTLFYQYHSDGRIKLRIDKSQSYNNRTNKIQTYKLTYYKFDTSGKKFRVKELKDTLIDNTVRDENNCIIRTVSNHNKTYFIKDSLCTTLQFIDEVWNDGECIAIFKGVYSYDQNYNLTEYKEYECIKNEQNTCSEFKLVLHFKYEYINLDLLTKKIKLNEKGKIINIDSYNYEYYE